MVENKQLYLFWKLTRNLHERVCNADELTSEIFVEIVHYIVSITEMSSMFHMCQLRSWSISKSFPVCMVAKYVAIMFASILQKHILGYN